MMLQTADRSQIILLLREAVRSRIILDNANIILLHKANHPQVILLLREPDHSRIISDNAYIIFLD